MNAESQESIEPEVIETEAEEETKLPEGEQPEGGETEQPATDEQDEEFDIVLDGEEEPAPQPSTIPKRVKKLLERNTALQSDLETSNTQAQNNAQEIERLHQELAQSRQPAQSTGMPMPPTEESVDYDPEKLRVAQAQYQADFQAWLASQQNQVIESKAQQAAQEERVKQENQALEAHYERADKLKVPDYDANEEQAVAIMGKSIVKGIASVMSNSAMVINYLGKNPAKAQEIALLDKTNPQKGIEKLWELNFNLKSVPRKKSVAPDPEVSIEGGEAPMPASKLQKKYDAAADKGDISTLRKIKKEAKAQGIKLT